MTREQIRYSLIFFGILDIVSFFRTYETVFYMWDNIAATLNFGFGSEAQLLDKILMLGIPMLNLTLVLLLIASGLFLIMGKKAGIIIYYFEFPLRLAFFILTFGFLLSPFGFQIGTWAYKLTLMLIAVLELARLIYSIWIQKKYFIEGQSTSP